jgi:hypothetical protein
LVSLRFRGLPEIRLQDLSEAPRHCEAVRETCVVAEARTSQGISWLAQERRRTRQPRRTKLQWPLQLLLRPSRRFEIVKCLRDPPIDEQAKEGIADSHFLSYRDVPVEAELLAKTGSPSGSRAVRRSLLVPLINYLELLGACGSRGQPACALTCHRDP